MSKTSSRQSDCLLRGVLLSLLGLALALWAMEENADAQPPYDTVEQEIWDRWEARFPGEGGLAVVVARCEGWNETARFDVAYSSPTSDVGPFQINQVHDDSPGHALRVLFGDSTRWPGPAATLEGNITTALYLREQRGGFGDWIKSQQCWRWAVGATFDLPSEAAIDLDAARGIEAYLDGLTPEHAIEMGPDQETSLAHTGSHPALAGFGLLLVGSGALALGARRRVQ